MRTVTSFHASDVPADHLNRIMADYLALEHARVFRRLLVRRFAALAAIVGAAGLLWLSAFAFWLGIGLCLAVPTWAWTVELVHERRLARQLDGLPTESVPTGASTVAQDGGGVRKS
jgi:hypothetical protein